MAKTPANTFIKRWKLYTWNELVDEYVRQDQNSRSKEEIERFAKIHSANSPLFKLCNRPDCGKFESRTARFKRCTKCKKVGWHHDILSHLVLLRKTMSRGGLANS